MEAEIAIWSSLDTNLRAERRVDAATELMAKAKTGDAAALEAIIRKHERRVFGLAFRLLGNLEDAKDVAQDVFLRMFRHLNTFDESRAIEPWLMRVTVNASRDHAKRWRSRETADETCCERADPSPNASQRLALRDEQQLVLDGLKTLSEHERTVVVLRDVEGMSTREIVEIVGSSETTVRSQLSRARMKLKQYRDARQGMENGL